jgi:hypothetical protein
VCTYSVRPPSPTQNPSPEHLRCKALGEAYDGILQPSLQVLAQSALLVNRRQQIGLVAPQVAEEVRLPCENLVDSDGIEVSVDTGIDEGNHFVDGHWRILLLLKEFGKTFATVERLLGGGIQIGSELGKRRDFTVLGQEELEGTSDLLHGLELGGRADTGHGKTDVDSWADTLVEEFGLQEDLAVGDGDNIGWNVSGHITALGLDDGQGSEGATAVLVAHLGGTLEKTGVEVENIAWIGFSPGRTTEQERHLTVGYSLLGQVIVDDKGMFAIVAEIFACNVLLDVGTIRCSE